MHKLFRLTVLFCIILVNQLVQSAELVLDSAYDLDTFVTGTASSDSGEVAVYDTSYPARTKLGVGTVDSTGKLAISVHPPLQEGHSLVAEDQLKVISPVITVQARRVGPVQ